MTESIQEQNTTSQSYLPPTPDRLRRIWTILLICLIIGSFLAILLVPNSKNIEQNTNSIAPTIQPSAPEERNPFREARNIKRRSDVQAIANAIEVYMQEQGTLPPGITGQIQPIAKAGADICAAISPTYIGAIPRDPQQQFDPDNPYSTGGSIFDCNESYISGYAIIRNNDESFTVLAPMTENMEVIAVTKK